MPHHTVVSHIIGTTPLQSFTLYPHTEQVWFNPRVSYLSLYYFGARNCFFLLHCGGKYLCKALVLIKRVGNYVKSTVVWKTLFKRLKDHIHNYMTLRQAKIESCVFLQKECAVLVYIDALSQNGKIDCDYVRCLPTLIFSLDEGVNWEKSYDPGQGIKNGALFFYGSFSVISLPPSSVYF